MGVRMIPYAHDNFRPAIHLLPKTETRKQENAMHAKTIRNCGTAQKKKSAVKTADFLNAMVNYTIKCNR